MISFFQMIIDKEGIAQILSTDQTNLHMVAITIEFCGKSSADWHLQIQIAPVKGNEIDLSLYVTCAKAVFYCPCCCVSILLSIVSIVSNRS